LPENQYLRIVNKKEQTKIKAGNPMEALKKAKGDSYYNKRAANYNKRRLKQDWWHVEQREMHDLLSGLPRNLDVVDIPFGTGRFAAYYEEFGHTISGLDASHAMLAAAQADLGPLYDKCTCITGDAANLPYSDGQFDLLVSTRFLRDIVLFETARQMLAEFARVTRKYAIIQLGETTGTPRQPHPQEVMGSLMSREMVDDLLAENGLISTERRLVNTLETEGDIYHILCEKF